LRIIDGGDVLSYSERNMPIRDIPLVTDETYHILNRGNASLPIFQTKRDYQRFIRTFLYYRNKNPPVSFSKLKELPRSKRAEILRQMDKENDFNVEIIAYCLMPNHFHFLARQVADEGIFNFMRRFANSYSCYFTAKNERRGTLFESRFKAVRVESESQLLHLSRYIHLNPFSSFLVKDIKELTEYPFSSLPEYLGLTGGFCCQEPVLSLFSSREEYGQFVFDRSDYQRSLEEIKHQLLE
jgi:putative transposase